MSALREREIPGYRSENQAKVVERGGRKRVAARQCGGPEILFVAKRERPFLDRTERFVDVQEPPARHQPFDRDTPEILPEVFQDAVLERIQGSPVDVATLGRDDVMTVRTLQQARHPQPRPWPNDAHHTCLGKFALGAADVAVCGSVQTGHRLPDCGEVVYNDEALNAQLFLHQCWADDPGIVRELQDFAADRTRECYCQFVRKRLFDAPPELLPGVLEAGELARLHGDRLAEIDNSAALDRRKRESSMCAAHVRSRNSSHRIPS